MAAEGRPLFYTFKYSTMMLIPLSTYLFFCVGALALILSPGPDFFYVATRGIAGGRRAGIASALGIGAGLLVHTLLAASGLTLILLASNWVFNAVKWLGVVYLFWMGLKILRASDSFLLSHAGAPRQNFARTFRQGVLTNLFNPKVALTFAAFLPGFVTASHHNAPLQMAVLGATLCVLATLWFCGVGAFAGDLGTFLLRFPRVGTGVRWGSGTILCLLGARLALVGRGAL